MEYNFQDGHSLVRPGTHSHPYSSPHEWTAGCVGAAYRPPKAMVISLHVLSTTLRPPHHTQSHEFLSTRDKPSSLDRVPPALHGPALV